MDHPAAAARLPVRDIRRLGQILGVAVSHGWGHVVDRLRLKGFLHGKAVHEPETGASQGARLRLALEELGPTFVKFGQLLSAREELFPEDVIAELRKLQDSVPPFSGTQARGIIEEELGGSVAQLFASFEETPFAAASMAQVHGASLADGTFVIVKVQRPQIERVIEADLEILFFLARMLRDHVPESRRYDPLGLVEEFAQTVSQELDFRREGYNADRFRENFADTPEVYVPRIFWELSSRRVLTMGRSTGHRADAAHPADPGERRRMADTLLRLFLTQLFEHGFFHGDPHPGNVFVMEDGRVCFHDFGIVGRLSPGDQEHLRQLFLALIARDAEWMTDVYFDMGVAAAGVERAAFVRDLDESLEQYYATSVREYSFAAILQQFIRLGQRHDIRVPREIFSVAKAFMAIESQARALDPNFNIIAALQSYGPRLIGQQVLPDLSRAALLVKGYRLSSALLTAVSRLPDLAGRVLRLLQGGEATLHVRHEQLEGLQHGIDRASNRLSLSLIIAAIVVGSSIVMSFHSGPHFNEIPLLGLIGYVLASLLGIWWAIAILRSGKL
jgi:ubiquinone biosynthesis protein